MQTDPATSSLAQQRRCSRLQWTSPNRAFPSRNTVPWPRDLWRWSILESKCAPKVGRKFCTGHAACTPYSMVQWNVQTHDRQVAPPLPLKSRTFMPLWPPPACKLGHLKFEKEVLTNIIKYFGPKVCKEQFFGLYQVLKEFLSYFSIKMWQGLFSDLCLLLALLLAPFLALAAPSDCPMQQASQMQQVWPVPGSRCVQRKNAPKS